MQAKFVLREIAERFRQCGLELHSEKTRIVYCRDINRPTVHPTTQFTFLGYTFRPRKAVDRYGRVFVNFAPAVCRDALRAMRQTIRGWHLQLMCDKQIDDLSRMFNPVLRGWANDYGRFHGSALKRYTQLRAEQNATKMDRLALQSADNAPLEVQLAAVLKELRLLRQMQ